MKLNAGTNIASYTDSPAVGAFKCDMSYSCKVSSYCLIQEDLLKKEMGRGACRWVYLSSSRKGVL